MKFFIQKGQFVLTGLFVVLLVTHAIVIFSHNSRIQNYFSLENSVGVDQAQESADASETPADGLKSNEILTSSTIANVLQTLLIIAGLALAYAHIRHIIQNRKRLNTITRALNESNNTFIFNSREQIDNQDEEAVKGRLILNLKKAREFIKAMSSGNYAVAWEGMNEENLDANKETLAGELLHMRDQMQRVKEEDQIRIWTTEGLSKFGEIIRKHQDNFDKLSENLISNVVNYVGAKVGGLFILEEDDKSNEKYLLLRASYAYDRKKYISKRVEIGEGIIGQCYVEAHTIYLAKVPNNYLTITSGLGGSNPNSLLVIPLRTNDKIEGVLEVASLKQFKPHEIEFLEKLGELLASSIVTVRTGEKTNHLLQISQEQGEEMRAQEEEMRQNMEELEATQEQMNRTVSELGVMKSSLEKEKYLLDSLLDNIPDSIYFKDSESKFIRVSKSLAGHFSGNVNDVVGKSDFDFQEKARAQEAYDDELNIMATRKPKVDYIEREILADGSEHWVSSTKMPLVNSKGEVVGTFGLSRDVTPLKKLELEVLAKDKRLAIEKKALEDKIKSLESQLRNSGSSAA